MVHDACSCSTKTRVGLVSYCFNLLDT